MAAETAGGHAQEGLIPPEPGDPAVVEAVLTASRTLVALAERPGGVAADDPTPAQYRALVVLAARGPLRMADLARARRRPGGCATGWCARG